MSRAFDAKLEEYERKCNALADYDSEHHYDECYEIPGEMKLAAAFEILKEIDAMALEPVCDEEDVDETEAGLSLVYLNTLTPEQLSEMFP